MPYRFDVDDAIDHEQRESLRARLRQTWTQTRCALIVGPHGSGKSTLLHDLASELQVQVPAGEPEIPPAWIQLTRDDSDGICRGWHNDRAVLALIDASVTVDPSQPGRVIVLDGAEQLSWLGLRRVRRRVRSRNARVLATAHRPLAGFTIVHRTSVRPAIVDVLLKQLTKNSTGIECAEVVGLLTPDERASVSNVRDLWSILYDRIGSGRSGSPF